MGLPGRQNAGTRARSAEIGLWSTPTIDTGPYRRGWRARLWRNPRAASAADKGREEGGWREGAEGNGAKAEKPEATEAAVPCE